MKPSHAPQPACHPAPLHCHPSIASTQTIINTQFREPHTMKIWNLLSHLARLRAAIQGAGCLLLMLLGTGFVAQASAGCLQYQGPLKPALWEQPSPGAVGLMKVSFREVFDDSSWPDHFGAPIVGLWAFKYTSKGNANK